MARRKRRTPARSASGRFVKRASAARRNPPKRRRRAVARHAVPARRRAARRNVYLANPRRRRSYRRNPPAFLNKGVFGVPLIDYLYAGGAFIAVPGIEALLLPSLPTGVTSTPAGKYAVKAALALGVGYAAGKFISREAGKAAMLGGGLYVLANAVVDFMPQIFGGFSGAFPGPVPVRGYIQGQPMLGLPSRTIGAYQRGQVGGGMSQAGTPVRLSLSERF